MCICCLYLPYPHVQAGLNSTGPGKVQAMQAAATSSKTDGSGKPLAKTDAIGKTDGSGKPDDKGKGKATVVLPKLTKAALALKEAAAEASPPGDQEPEGGGAPSLEGLV